MNTHKKKKNRVTKVTLNQSYKNQSVFKNLPPTFICNGLILIRDRIIKSQKNDRENLKLSWVCHSASHTCDYHQNFPPGQLQVKVCNITLTHVLLCL